LYSLYLSANLYCNFNPVNAYKREQVVAKATRVVLYESKL